MTTSPNASTLTKQRPKHPPRMGSFSKRNASVDGLREVPLPGGAAEGSSTTNKLKKERRESSGDAEEDWQDLGLGALSLQEPTKTETILPYARPYSQPPASPNPDPTTMTPTTSSALSDRMSSASLPLPTQIPFHALPRATPTSTIPEDGEAADLSTTPTATSTAPIPPPPAPRPFSRPPTAISRPPSISRQRPSTSSSLSSSSSTSSYPAPEPPTILQPPLPSTHPRRNDFEPHAPFLAPTPPPPDAWIEVETTQSEYRLNVHLPGFKRDAITLATKKRRILHVVADSWEAGGGHFERRISFGYDADLVSVRAEFDGQMLRVIVPRRVNGMGSMS